MNAKGEVDYSGAHQDSLHLEKYLTKIKAIDEEAFDRWPREEKLAFFLNAFNAGAIKVILLHYPVKSILDIPGVWDYPVIHVGRLSFSLNQIRSGELLGVFRDEKIHTALSYGCRGCPRLRREVFTGPRVEGQLFLATQEFVNDLAYNEIIPGEKKIRISRIFKWHGRDFQLDFGFPETEDSFSVTENAVLSFLAYYLQDGKKIEYLKGKGYKIKYLPFDWSLNQWSREAEQKT